MSIRRYAVAVTLCAGACLGPGTPSGQTLSNDLRASISLATDYRQNGLSQNYGKPSWRLAVDYEHDSGFFAGGFLANVEYEAEASRRTPRDLQADFYAGYVWRGSEWTTSVSMSRYIYPDIDFRYDYTLATASASFRDRYFFGVSYTDNLLSIDRSARHYEIGASLPWIWGLEWSGNAGYFSAEDFLGIQYSHWDTGLSKIFGRFALDLRFHDNTEDRVTILGDPGGESWVFSAAYAIAPRD